MLLRRRERDESWRCSSCWRKLGRRAECDTCNQYNERRRKTLVAGGKRRLLTPHLVDHLRSGERPEVTRERIVYVLENWVIRGVHTKRQSMNYLAFVPEVDTVIRVAVSLDDKRIVTAYPDRTARNHLIQGEFAYFANQLANMEVRDATAG